MPLKKQHSNARSPHTTISSSLRFFSSSLSTCAPSLTVGVLRETYDKWERRAPLCPIHVKDFLQAHPSSKVIVQPSPSRIFSNQDYSHAGATIQDDLSGADLILGVKRPQSTRELIPHKTYMLFSHVIKGQPANMPLLQDVLDKHIALVDYECIVEGGLEQTKRVVAFGKYAGLAGMMDSFQALGRRLLLKDFSTPFLNTPPSILHHNLREVKRSVGILRDRLEAEGLPADLEPLVFSITGKGGNVYSGVREIFDMLPHEVISLEDLPDLQNQSGPHYKVYGVALGSEDIYQRTDDGCFDRKDFQQNPCLYESTFADKVAPYTHVLVNCIHWDHRFPRLLAKEDMRRLYESGNER
jgi:alpha-aminoadipic semialdehyde synthase